MNFFQHQDDAKRKTSRLVFLLIAAVLTLIAITAITIAAFMYFFGGFSAATNAAQSTSFGAYLIQLCVSPAMLYIALSISAVVFFGSLYKANELKRGGDYVAHALGGRLLHREQATAKQAMLLNVVEEMAIASGTVVPRVYLLEENGINVFAAGTKTSNAVIGITSGCIETLNREQLQGVIAHEFSHIHHGDMKLNMNLTAVLHGILLIGLIGQILVRSGSGSAYYDHNPFIRKRTRGAGKAAFFGIALMAIGFGGVFFGNIIKAAVSRQREFLADASAVQFTRNPQGIAAALFKIQTHLAGSTINASHASEFSHFYFANGVHSFYAQMFATHPPLDLRIKRVYPAGITTLAEIVSQEKNEDSEHEDSSFSELSNAEQSNTQSEKATEVSSSAAPQQSLDALINNIGVISPEAVEYSHALLAILPAMLHQACENAYQARAVVYALLIDTDEDIKQKQIAHLKARAHPVTFREFLKLHEQVAELDPRLHFPILQIAQAALQNSSEPQKKLFKENLIALAKADERISLREWSIITFVLNSMTSATPKGALNLDELKKDISELLGFVCLLNEKEHQRTSLVESIGQLWDIAAEQETGYTVPESINISKLNKALSNIQRLTPIKKPQLLKAIAFCMNYDKNVTLREQEILRTISSVLDCPMPIISQ